MRKAFPLVPPVKRVDEGTRNRQEQPIYRIDAAQIKPPRSDGVPSGQWLGEIRRIVAVDNSDEDA